MSIFSSFANPAASGEECALYRGSNCTNKQRDFLAVNRQLVTVNWFLSALSFFPSLALKPSHPLVLLDERVGSFLPAVHPPSTE